MAAFPSASRAQVCPANAEPYSTDTSDTETVVHCRCMTGYDLRDGACQLREKPVVPGCEAEQHQAELDRERVERLRNSGEAGQEELREWTKMNADAQRDALLDAVKFAAGEYAAKLAKSKYALTKLKGEADLLGEGALRYGPETKAGRQYAAEFASALNNMRPQMTDVLGRKAVKGVLDADKIWELSRDTMHADVAAAAQQNDKLHALLKDPKFNEALTGGNNSASANAEAFKTTADAALELTIDNAKFLKRFSKVTGPAVRAGEFVVDAAYDFWASAESTEMVLEQSDAAGKFAQATAALQKQHKKSVDALQACKAGD